MPSRIDDVTHLFDEVERRLVSRAAEQSNPGAYLAGVYAACDVLRMEVADNVAAVVEQVLRGFARDVVAPLTGAHNALETLRRTPDLTRDVTAELLRVVERDLETVADLVATERLLGAVEADAPVIFDLRAQVSGAVADALPVTSLEVLDTRLPDHAVDVLADPVTIRRTLQQLLAAAELRAPPGTVVLVELVVRPLEAHVRVLHGTGQGATPTRRGSGVQAGDGLWFAEARYLARRYQGDLTVEQTGDGRVITLRLPLARPPRDTITGDTGGSILP